MTRQSKPETPSVRDIPVWDLPTRLFHWLLVGLITVMVISGLAGRLGIHMQLGRAVLALLLFRFAWGFVGSSTARFSQFVKGPRAALDFLRLERAGGSWRGIGHNPLGAYSVLAMLLLSLAQGITGLFTSDDVLTDGPLVPLVNTHWEHLLSDVHRVLYVLLLVVVGLHVAAIVFYKKVKKDDLIRPMITGRKPLPADAGEVIKPADAGEMIKPAGAGEAMKPSPLWLAALLMALSAFVVWGGLSLVHG